MGIFIRGGSEVDPVGQSVPMGLGGGCGGILVPKTVRATDKRLSRPVTFWSNPLESLMPGQRVPVMERTMGEITVVLDRDVAEQLVRRIRHPFHVNVGSEAAFQRLLAALESALEIS